MTVRRARVSPAELYGYSGRSPDAVGRCQWRTDDSIRGQVEEVRG